MGEIDDKEILEKLFDPQTRRKGFEMLVRQYSEQMYWQVRRMALVHEDANDILQNVFMKVWSSIDTFRNASKLSTWLFRIATNECLDFIRKKKTRALDNADTLSEHHVADMLSSDKYFDGDYTQALLYEAITKLPDVQRTVFNLRYFEELKYSEISEILHTSEGALKASYHIAVKKISDYLKRQD